MLRGEVSPRDGSQVRHPALVAAADVEEGGGVAHHVEARNRVPAHVHGLGVAVEAQAVGVDADADPGELAVP